MAGLGAVSGVVTLVVIEHALSVVFKGIKRKDVTNPKQTAGPPDADDEYVCLMTWPLPSWTASSPSSSFGTPRHHTARVVRKNGPRSQLPIRDRAWNKAKLRLGFRSNRRCALHHDRHTAERGDTVSR